MRTAIAICLLLALFTSIAQADTPADTHLVRKMYAIIPSIVDFDLCHFQETRDPEYSANAVIKEFFAKEGVPFPEGAQIFYHPASFTVTMLNTEESHRIFNRVLHQLHILPEQVEINAMVIQFDHSLIESTLRETDENNVRAETLLDLYSTDNGNLLHTLNVVTRSGVNAQNQSVYERIYPTEFELTSITTQTATATSDVQSALVPGDFETREVGTILNVTPTVGPSAAYIDLTLVFEISRELEDSIISTKAEHTVLELTQPVFHSKHMTTSVVLRNGQSISFGGWDDEKGETLTYLILTATLLDAKGEPFETHIE